MSDINKTDRKLSVAEKRIKALELRRDGVDYRTIAEKVGWKSHSSAVEAVHKELNERTSEAVEALRQVEAERLDWLWRKVVERIDTDHLWAVDRGVKVIEQRRSLFGLDTVDKPDLAQEARRYLDLYEQAIRDAQDRSEA